jgi:alkanesulfonate monooxygenase SsuD/methylene tetrahydromethanopterin reductase-like flavin-dependent oxidoreductase (luciferase family)
MPLRRGRGMQSEKDMRLGLYLRNMGPQSIRPLIADAARAAEEAGIDDLWVADTSRSRRRIRKDRTGVTSSRWRRSPFSPGLPNEWPWAWAY